MTDGPRICVCGHELFWHSTVTKVAMCRMVEQWGDSTWHDCECEDFQERVVRQ